ncbi:hypothetical protein AYI70_g9152 [Smittium culicis]|uniref:Uncharacterized protein n=1 Tax=Smittium culicis TaxID=133412 RepID=A0A1R1XCN3_9FUNG|nr:hypothetical protein AYI70_g9152 [Smittium culicis]
METTNTSAHKKQSSRWADVISVKTKPSDIIRRYEKKFVPVWLFKTTKGNSPFKRKISCLGGTSLKLGISMKEFNDNIEDFVEIILTQFCEIQTWFEIDNRRHILFLNL